MLDAFDVLLYSIVLATLMREFAMSKATAALLNALTLIASALARLPRLLRISSFLAQTGGGFSSLVWCLQFLRSGSNTMSRSRSYGTATRRRRLFRERRRAISGAQHCPGYYPC